MDNSQYNSLIDSKYHELASIGVVKIETLAGADNCWNLIGYFLCPSCQKWHMACGIVDIPAENFKDTKLQAQGMLRLKSELLTVYAEASTTQPSN